MVRTVERIEQELAILDQSVEAIAQEFHDTYNQYLSVLGQAVRQQLILAGYHLCTQGYSERFLKLSLAQRQQLQQGLRHLAKQAKTQLLERLQPIEALDDSSSLTAFADTNSISILVSNRELLLEEIVLPDEESLDEESLDEESLDEESLDEESLDERSHSESKHQGSDHPSNQRLNESGNEPLTLSSESSFTEPLPAETPLTEPSLTALGSASERFETDPKPYSANSENLDHSHEANRSDTADSNPDIFEENTEPRPLHPRQIARWQERLEAAIVEELQTLSHAANCLLQQSHILPSRLPEPVLEVAARADISSEATASPPNLLNLMVETENDNQKESTMTQLMAIRLRLAEIEFSDSSTTIWRSKIRDLLGKLSRLGREYQKKQKEYSIAQAEAAWRSSWYED